MTSLWKHSVLLPKHLQEYPGIAALDSLPMWGRDPMSPLEVPRRLLEVLGNPQNQVPAIHIGGTNGKGSVAAALNSILMASGMRVGQFSSPHLSCVTERCMVQGASVAPEVFDDAVTRVLSVAEELKLSPSYFVVTALASFLVFSEASLDYMIIEVGLGGIYDATNLLAAPKVCCITSVGYDHTEHLGESLKEIAENKVGIAKAGVPFVVGRLPHSALEVVKSHAERISFPLEVLGMDFEVSDAMQTEMPLAQFQKENMALAEKIAGRLGVPEEAISEGLQTMHWPGRMEWLMSGGLQYLLDAAHNIDGVSALCEYLSSDAVCGKYERLMFLVSFLSRKKWQPCAARISDAIALLEGNGLEVRCIATEARDESAVAADELAKSISGAIAIGPYTEALAYARRSSNADTLLVLSGSIYFIGDVRPLLV